MKNNTIMIIGMYLFASSCSFEKAANTTPDSNMEMSTYETTGSDEYVSDQSRNTRIITNVLGNYTEEKMRQAIMLTYDESILIEKTSAIVMNDLSALLSELKNAQVEKIISESYNSVSLKMSNNNHEYILDISFVENSQKISGMAFAQLN